MTINRFVEKMICFIKYIHSKNEYSKNEWTLHENWNMRWKKSLKKTLVKM